QNISTPDSARRCFGIGKRHVCSKCFASWRGNRAGPSQHVRLAMPLLKRATWAALLLCLPQAAGAQSENNSRRAENHWVNDPDSGCALFDASLRPGDEVSWSGDCAEGRADGKGTARFTNNGAEFERFTGSFRDGVAEDGPVQVSWGAGWSYDGVMTG